MKQDEAMKFDMGRERAWNASDASYMSFSSVKCRNDSAT